MLDRASLIIII